MHEALVEYRLTILALGAMGGLLVLQLLIADLLGIPSKHTPGSAVEVDHDDLFFRATRAFSNTNESLAAFGLLAIFSVAIGAAPGWTNGLAGSFVAARLGHMVCYYANWKIARSVSFGVALFSLFGLAINGAMAALV